MLQDETVPCCLLEATEKDFDYWLSRNFISPELRAELKRADLLVVPDEWFRGRSGPLFPSGTETFVAFLRDNKPDSVRVDIAIEDCDYKELALKDNLLILAAMAAGSFVAQVAVNLVSEFLTRRMLETKGDDSVRWTLTVVDKERGKAARISYHGPTADFLPTMRNAVDAFNRAQEGHRGEQQ